MKTSQYLYGLLFIFLGNISSAGLMLTYHKLAMMNLDQMNQFVQSRIKESRKAYSGKSVPLKEGLQAVLGRPNEDGMVEKVIGPLKKQLEEIDALEKSYKELVDEAINALKHPQNFKPDVQVTYSIFLENLISEFKPLIGEGGFEKSLVEKISAADIELTKAALKERKLRLMKEGASPSEIAKLVLTPPPPPEPEKTETLEKSQDESKAKETETNP